MLMLSYWYYISYSSVMSIRNFYESFWKTGGEKKKKKKKKKSLTFRDFLIKGCGLSSSVVNLRLEGSKPFSPEIRSKKERFKLKIIQKIFLLSKPIFVSLQDGWFTTIYRCIINNWLGLFGGIYTVFEKGCNCLWEKSYSNYFQTIG